MVDDPTFRRRESPPGSEKAGTYQSPVAEVLTTGANERSNGQVAPHEQAYLVDEVTSHMPGAFDENEQSLEYAETESKLSKKERKKKDKQAKRQDTTGSYSSDLHGESLGQSRDFTPPERQDQKHTVLVEDPEEYFPDTARDTAVPYPFPAEAPKGRKTDEDLRRKESAFDDNTSVATAPIVQAQADTYLSDEARSTSASVPAATETTKDKRKKKKSRRTGSVIDDDVAVATPPLVQARDVENYVSDDARSPAAPGPIPTGTSREKKKKKSKRHDSTYEEEFSVVSSSTTRDEAKYAESKPRNKKGGLFGLFGRSSVDVSEPSHPGTEATAAEAADVEEPKRRSKKRSKDRPSYRDLEEVGPIDADADADDDLAIISGRKALPPEVSIPASTGHDPFSPSHNRLTNPEDGVSGRSLEAKTRNLSLSDLTQQPDLYDHSQPVSFLGMRQDLPLPPDIPNPVDFVPKANPIEKSEPFLEAIAESTIASRRSSSPTGLHRAIEPHQGTSSLPSSPTGKPKVPSQRLSELQNAESPLHTPSPTAVPFHFRVPPSSPSASRASVSQPQTPSAPGTVSAPSRPKLRPRSTEFKISNEFRPLWLVSKHASRREGPVDEVYPSLPSSHTTSRSSSVHDADEYSYDSNWDNFQAFENQERSGEATESPTGGMGPEVDPGLLDSQQPTPTAASFPAAVRDDMQPSVDHDHKSLEQPNLAATKVQLDELPPLPVSGPSSPAMSVMQEVPRASSNLKAITLGAVLGASVLGAVEAVQRQQASTASSDRKGKEPESEMVETAHPHAMVSAPAANEPVVVLENEIPSDEDRPAAEQKPSDHYTKSTKKSTPFDQPLTVAPLSAQEQRMIQEQDTQDAVDILFSATSEKRSPREPKRKGKKRGRAPLSTASQSLHVGEPSVGDISTATNIDDGGKPGVEELAMQRAIDLIMASNSVAEAKSQGGPVLTKDMPVTEIVERMSNAAEGPTGERDTLPASSTTKSEKSSEVQLEAVPPQSGKRSGKNMNRGSSVTLQTYPVEESSMALGDVRELEPSDQSERYSVKEVETTSMNVGMSDPARDIPTTETPSALNSAPEASELAIDNSKSVSSSKRKAKKDTNMSKETARSDTEPEVVLRALSASHPNVDEKGVSTTDAAISELTPPPIETAEFLSQEPDLNFKLASSGKSKKSKKNRKNVHDYKDLGQEHPVPKESVALEQKFVLAESISEDTHDPGGIPHASSYQTTLRDVPEAEGSTHIHLPSTLSSVLHVQPEDVPLPESTDLDLFVTTPPLKASPAETEPSDPKQAIAESSVTQVLPQYPTAPEHSSQSPVSTDQRDDPTNHAPTKFPERKGKKEKTAPGQSTDGEAPSSAGHVGTVSLNQAIKPREESNTIAHDADPLRRAADDMEPHNLPEHHRLQSDSVKSEAVGNVVLPDEIELPEHKLLQADTTIHNDVQHTDNIANGPDAINGLFNEADRQDSRFAQRGAVYEEGKKPISRESAQIEMGRSMSEIASSEPAVGAGVSSAMEMHVPQSESVIHDGIGQSPHSFSEPAEDSYQLRSSLEASEPMTAVKFEIPQFPVAANQPVSGTQGLKPSETTKEVPYNVQILVPETVTDSSRSELNLQTSQSAQIDEAELPAARYSISENQPISDQLDPEPSGPINDSHTKILEPIVATVDRPDASPRRLSPVQQSYDQAERLPPIFDDDFLEMAPNIQSHSPPKPDLSAFLDESLREAREPQQSATNSPTIDHAKLKDGWDDPGQPAKTNTSRSVKAILGIAGTTPTEEKTPPSLTIHTVDSELLVPQIEDEGNGGNFSGPSKRQRKKGLKSRTNQVPKPATDPVEHLPTVKPSVAMTNTAEDVQTILDIRSAEQSSALTRPRPEPVIPATEFEIAEKGHNEDQIRLPSSEKSEDSGRGKYVERERPADSLTVEAEAPEALGPPILRIQPLENQVLLEHGNTTLQLEKSNDIEGLDAHNDQGMEPVGQNTQTLRHPSSVDKVTDLEPGALNEGYMQPVEQREETIDYVKSNVVAKGIESNPTEEEHLELTRPGKEISNSHYSVRTAEYLEAELADKLLIDTDKIVEEGLGVGDIVETNQKIHVEPREVASAEANDLSLIAREVNNVPHKNDSNTQFDSEIMGIISPGSLEKKSRNEARSASHQTFDEPLMGPVEVGPQASEPAELSDGAKALEEALESQDISWTASSSSKKDKKKAKKKNKSAAREDEANIPGVDSYEESGATELTSDTQIPFSTSDKREKKRGKKGRQLLAWEESVASSADNDPSTVQLGPVLDSVPKENTNADEELDRKDLYNSEEAASERNAMTGDKVDLDSATRAVEAAVSSTAATNNNPPMSKKDKKKKKKTATSQPESRNDDFPTAVPAIEAEFATGDTGLKSPAESSDIPMTAPVEGLEDISSTKKKSKKDKRREKTQWSPWEEETAPQAEVVGPREDNPKSPSQESSETVANLAEDIVDGFNTSRKSKKGRKGKKTGLQPSLDHFEPTTLENVATGEISISENPVQSVRKPLPTIDEVRVVEPAVKAVVESQDQISPKSVDNPDEASIMQIEPSDDKNLGIKEPESTQIISGGNGKNNKFKKENPSALPWDDNETPQVETTDAEFSDARTMPTTPALKLQDQNAPLQAEYEHQAHGSDVQTPVTAVRDAPTEEATYELKKSENVGFSPTTVRHSVFTTELESLPGPDAAINFSASKWERSEMQPRALDLDEEIEQAASQVVEEAITEGSSKPSLDQLIDEPTQPHVPESVAEPNQQQIENPIHYTEGFDQPSVAESIKTQLEEPQSRIEATIEKPLEKPIEPHLKESMRSPLDQRAELQPTESAHGLESDNTDFAVGEHNLMERTKESLFPDEKKEVAEATSQIIEKPLEGDSSNAGFGPYLEKPDPGPPAGLDDRTVYDPQASKESQLETPNDARMNTLLSPALNQKQNFATPDAEANQAATASPFNKNNLSDTMTAILVSTSPEQAHKRSFFEDEGPEVTVEDEAAIEPPPKATRTDADPPSQKIVDMEEKVFAVPRKSKKKRPKKAADESPDVEKPQHSTQIDNVPSAVPSRIDQAGSLKPEYSSYSAEPSQPRDLPGLAEVHAEDVSREVGPDSQSIETMNEVDPGNDPWEPPAKKGKKGKKQKSTAVKDPADPQVIKTESVDPISSDLKAKSNLEADSSFQSIPPTVNVGDTDAHAEYAANDDPSLRHQQNDTTEPNQPAATFDESASLLGTKPLPGAEVLPPQDEESSPFAFLPKNKRSKKKKQKEPIIWEDDTATAPVAVQDDKDTVQKSTPIPEPQPATSEFDDLHRRPDEPPEPQMAYPERTVGAQEASARRSDERNDYFGIATQVEMGLDVKPQVPPFELQEQADEKASVDREVPTQDVVGLVDNIRTATKTESDHQAPQHIPGGKVMAVDEISELVDGSYPHEMIEFQPMPERRGLNPEENVVGKGEDVPVLADKNALQVDDQTVEVAQKTTGSDADEDNGLQEQQITREALGAMAVPGSEDTQLVDPGVEEDVFAIPVYKKSKKKSKRRAYAAETMDPRDLEDPAYKEAIDQRGNISMPRSRSSSPRQSSMTIEDQTQNDRIATQEGQAPTVGILGADASLADTITRRDSKKGGKNKKKRKGKVWDGEEIGIPETMTSHIHDEAKQTSPSSKADQQISLTHPRSPERLSTQHMEDYDTYDNRQVIRDSAVHVSDSPIVSDSLPAYRMFRDSGYQDTEASPIVGLRRPASFDRMSTTEASFVERIAPEEEDQDHDARKTQVPEGSAANPYNMPVEADPANATRALSPVLEVPGSRAASRSQNEHMAFAQQGLKTSSDRPSSRPDNDPPPEPMSLNPVFDQRSDAGRNPDARGILPSPSPRTHDDRREPSPVSPSSKDRSSILFQSSPSTREELASIQQRSSSPFNEDQSRNERAINPSRGDKDTIQDAAPHQSLFGGPPPPIADNERPSAPTSPNIMEDSARRPLDTIREYSPEESPLQRKTRIRPHSPSPERGNRRRRTADRQEGQRGHVPEIDTSKLISTDDIISGMSWPAVDEEEHVVDLERSRSRTTENRAPSRQSVISPSGEVPKPRSFSGASIRSTESINAIIRTPDQMRSASGLSYHSSGTPPLRRVDRSLSGDLRAKSLAKQTEPAPQTIASSSTYDPTKDKGKDRMADVYVSPFLPSYDSRKTNCYLGGMGRCPWRQSNVANATPEHDAETSVGANLGPGKST